VDTRLFPRGNARVRRSLRRPLSDCTRDLQSSHTRHDYGDQLLPFLLVVFVRSSMTATTLWPAFNTAWTLSSFLGIGILIAGMLHVWRESDSSLPSCSRGVVFSGRGGGLPPCGALNIKHFTVCFWYVKVFLFPCGCLFRHEWLEALLCSLRVASSVVFAVDTAASTSNVRACKRKLHL
jgi:hypothetical protein